MAVEVEDRMGLRERVKRYQWQDLFTNRQVIIYPSEFYKDATNLDPEIALWIF